MTTARDVIEAELNEHGADFIGDSRADIADAILAALEAAGFQVVPREPTADMLVEGNLVIARNRLFATEIYKAMLTAAKEKETT